MLQPINQELLEKYKYSTLSGADFKKNFGKEKFVKLTNADEIHYGHEYKTGLNEDYLDFNPNGYCSSGGLYFTTLYYASLYMGGNMYYREVTLLEDSDVYVEDRKFKTKKFILSDRKEISELWNDEYFFMAAVQQNGRALQFAKKQTPEICMAAAQQDGRALKYVKPIFRTPEICMAAVQQNGHALQFVEPIFRTPEICMAAMQENGRALYYVKKQTPEICMAAVQQDGCALQSVEPIFDTLEISMAAVQQNGYTLQFVEPIFRTPEICMAAVQENSRALCCVKKQTPEICMAAVQQDGRALYYVKKQTPEICMAAVQQNGHALQFVEPIFDTPEIRMAAV